MKFLSKEILGKTAKIIRGNIEENANTDEVFCEFVNDNDCRLEFFNGTIYEGPISKGKLDGHGTLSYPDGSVYSGHFKNNTIDGPGEVHYSAVEGYKGEFHGFQRHGQGLYWNRALGLKYFGEWAHDKMRGRGKLDIAGKWTFEGSFEGNSKHGWGRLGFKSKNLYCGEFKTDQKDGLGRMDWATPPETFRGQWQRNCISGFGLYIYKDHLTTKKPLCNFYLGFFKKGLRQGLGLHLYSDGSTYIGNWNANLKHGSALFIDSTGEHIRYEFDSNRRMKEHRPVQMGRPDRSLGFVFKSSGSPYLKASKKQLVNILMSNKAAMKSLYSQMIIEFGERREECFFVGVDSMVRILQRLKLVNHSSGSNVLWRLLRLSKHNFVYLGYNEVNIEVRMGFWNVFINIEWCIGLL